MGSTVALVCSTAFLLVLLCSASEDERNFEQREVTFDIDKIMQEMQQPDDFMLQKEVDLADLFDPAEFTEQVIVSPPEQFDTLSEIDDSRPRILTPRGRRPSFGPRSFDVPPEYDPIQFPVGQPTENNLQAICLNAAHRPTYPDSFFPASGYGQQKRRASAVNNAESWFRTCCKGNQTWEREVTLCCFTQAWELSVNSFCEEDTSIKDRHYHCCKLTAGSDRLKCFHDDAPNPNYEATEGLPRPPLLSKTNFTFDPNTCQRTKTTLYSVRGNRRKKEKKQITSASKKVRMHFPPGRPTADNIEALCRDQKLRPVFKTNCMPGEGYMWLVRQAKAINRIEKRYKQCCKKEQGVLDCADLKWRGELNRYCVDAIGQDHCCPGGAKEQVDCFQTISPDPHYNRTSDKEELALHNLCDTHKMIKKKFPVGFPLKSFVNQCCPMFEMFRDLCFNQKFEEMSKMCLTHKTAPPAVHRCCLMSSQTMQQCLTNILMDAITKATTAIRQKKKKRCPLS
ncbi:extracellular matrix protein 1-like isoform X1 [Sebastes umbrosus]|uniref:extracellular matrix protein 1-like isoform X1 n=1 Tax=Sebastes umbrosus TaxID=72105 RepID=UPI00189E4CE4|nr:extracellular matrix protein 1-like isoform X1 [Sebastes umbrosus]